MLILHQAHWLAAVDILPQVARDTKGCRHRLSEAEVIGATLVPLLLPSGVEASAGLRHVCAG